MIKTSLNPRLNAYNNEITEKFKKCIRDSLSKEQIRQLLANDLTILWRDVILFWILICDFTDEEISGIMEIPKCSKS